MEDAGDIYSGLSVLSFPVFKKHMEFHMGEYGVTLDEKTYITTFFLLPSVGI